MNDYQKTFIKIDRVEPRENLYGNILLRIDAKKRFSAKIRLIYTSVIGVISIGALVPAIKYLVTEISQSGFWQYLSLAFSDWQITLTYWKEFGLTLLESIPTVSITATLILIFIFIITLKFIIQDSKTIFTRTQLA